MIFKKFFTLDYLYQNTFHEVNQHYKFLNDKKLIFPNTSYFYFNNQQSAFYSFHNKTLNIPKNFFKEDINYLQFSSIQQFLKSESIEFITKHEVGHLNHHEWLLNHNNQILNSKSNYIKTKTTLDEFFNRTLTKDNPVDDFIHINFTESYADSYAGLTSYLYEKNINIFEKIIQFRKHNLTQLTKPIFPKTKLNKDESILEIKKGKYSTSRYSNFLVSEYLQNNIVKIFSIEQLQSLTIDKLHNLLQIEILKSLGQTLKNEINDNPLFSNDFNKYLLIKHISVETYFNKFEIGIKEYQNQTILNIIQSSFINHNKDLLIDFIDFHIKNKFQPYTFQVPLFTIIEESQITSSIIEIINNGHKVDYSYFSKFITNEFIIPIHEFNSFMKYMEQKDTSNPKFNEIINSLEPDLINSLIQYNKLPISNTPLPKVTSYSKKEIIDIITEELSEKEKKQLIYYIEKNNIKEITTAYLSSSDFNVANETQFKLKSKQDIFSKIIGIENNTKPHNEANQNEVQKIKIK